MTVLTHCKPFLMCCRAFATSLAKLPLAGSSEQPVTRLSCTHRYEGKIYAKRINLFY